MRSVFQARSVSHVCDFERSRRRQFLGQLAASAVTAAGLSTGGCAWLPSAPVSSALRRKDFIIHDATNWETRPTAFGAAPITPYGKLYVCNHLPFLDARVVTDRSRWLLDVRGTADERRLSLAELRAFGSTSMTMVLQCAGNGRGFFDHRPDGPMWGTGAVGCVTWTGAPLGRVVAALGGVERGARYATATGGEPVNEMLDELFSMRVERSIPIAKALDDCLLAWDMNGSPIPRVHGGPLRLIVPGYFGINQIKYLKRLAFTEEQSDADVMQHAYRCRPVGVEGNETQPTTWAMNAKSILWPPALRAVRRGSSLHGVAFGGLEPVERIEITWTDGRDWQAVPFSSPDAGPYAWRWFNVPVDVPRGSHRVASRAVDKAGRRQPEWRTPNAGGYANASWRDHALDIDVV